MRKIQTITTELIPTDNDVELVRMIAEEMRPKEIAKKKQISVKTVESQIFYLKKKFSKKTVPGLLMLFVRNGFIE